MGRRSGAAKHGRDVKVWRVVTCAVALAAGVVVLLLAHDVGSWHRVTRNDTVDVSRPGATRVPADPATILPATLSASLLGIDRDRQWTKAIRTFDRAYDSTIHREQLAQDEYRLLNAGEAALGKVTQDPDPERASRAYNLLSVLVFREAYPGTVVVRRLVQEALADEQSAVRLDPTDEPAKENLELTLRVLVAVALAPQQARAAGTRRANERKGGYQGPPGAGY